MLDYIKGLFALERKPRKGLLPAEWVVIIYLVATSVLMIIMLPRLYEPWCMTWLRLKVVGVTLLFWLVYRMRPCRLTLFLRIFFQMLMLAWWYPDTYEFNRSLPNLDHLFARWEQDLFGCQLALLFSQAIPHPLFSELMDLGYAAYFPMIAIVTIYYFLARYEQFGRASFMIITSFFAYYIIFIALPVTGPQFYYAAVSVEDIAHGVFPNVTDWFATHQDVLESPGYKDGFFYNIVADAHEAGERPTAAYPSSHVGIATILMLLAWNNAPHGKGRGKKRGKGSSRWLFWVLLPFYVLLCLSTVYIMAHYVVDVLAGWISALLFYFIINSAYRALNRKV